MCLVIISQLQIRSVANNNHFIPKVAMTLLRRISIAGYARALLSLGCNHLLLTANCTSLESYFELLCTSLSFVRPPDKIPASVNYTLLCTGIMTLNHNGYEIMNVIGCGIITCLF